MSNQVGNELIHPEPFTEAELLQARSLRWVVYVQEIN